MEGYNPYEPKVEANNPSFMFTIKKCQVANYVNLGPDTISKKSGQVQ